MINDQDYVIFFEIMLEHYYKKYLGCHARNMTKGNIKDFYENVDNYIDSYLGELKKDFQKRAKESRKKYKEKNREKIKEADRKYQKKRYYKNKSNLIQ